MIPLAAWKDLILADARDLCIGGSIIFGSGIERALDSGDIASFTIEEGADGALMPGAVLSANCRIDLVNDEGQWLPGGSMLGGQILIGATLILKLGARTGASVFWQDLGVFQVEGAVCAEAEAIMRLSCADSISSELYAPFADTLSYPATLEQVWLAAVGQTRYEWSGSVPNGTLEIAAAPDWQGMSLRGVLGMTAAVAGCFVCVDRSGSLRLKSVVSQTEYALDAAHYIRLERDDAFYGPVDALRLTPAGEGAAERVYYAGDEQTALHAISVQNNPLFRADDPKLDVLAAGMLHSVAGYYTEKGEFTWRGDPALCIGDRILLTDRGERAFAGILARQSMSYDGRFQAVCSCLIPEKADSGVRRAITPEGGLNAAALTGAINGSLLSVGSVTTNKLSAGAVTAEKLAAGAVDAGALSAVTAKLQRLTAADIETDALAAAFAAFTVVTAGTADFDRATVAHLVAHALNLSYGTAEDVYIENLRLGYAQMVSASVGSLCIRAADGSYYALSVDENGCVSASPVEVGEGEIAGGATESGRVILETDITADSLSTSDLLSTYALINRIDAARIDVDQLFARNAFIAALNTADISSNTYIRQSIADSVTGEIAQFVRLDADGLHVGEQGQPGEVCIDESAVNVVLNRRKYSVFGANFARFGKTELRGASDGGMLFRTVQEVI